jgi:hypothetical protein
MPAFIAHDPSGGSRVPEIQKGELLTAEEMTSYLEVCGVTAQLELYSSTNVLRVERHKRYTERYRLGSFPCGVRWERVS